MSEFRPGDAHSDDVMPDHLEMNGDAGVAILLDDHDLELDDGDLLEDELELELDEAPAGDAGPIADDGLRERLERLEQDRRRREARRVNPKVAAATAGGALAGLLPAILEIADALDLPPSLEGLVPVIAAAVATFAAGWATPSRAPAE